MQCFPMRYAYCCFVIGTGLFLIQTARAQTIAITFGTLCMPKRCKLLRDAGRPIFNPGEFAVPARWFRRMSTLTKLVSADRKLESNGMSLRQMLAPGG